MSNDIETKLKKLREKYPSDISLREIDNDERQLRTLIAQKDFANHDVVIDFITDAKKKISDINFLLAYDDEFNQPEKALDRRSLWRERQVWQFILDRFGIDVSSIDQQIELINEEVDNQLVR